MKLLVVTQYFWPENFKINDLVSELVARGHEVTVLTGEPNYPGGLVFPAFRANPGAFAKHNGTDVIRVPMLARGQGSLRLLLNYMSFAVSGMLIGPIRVRGISCDAILVYEPSPITVGLPGILLRRLKRVPLAFWVQDLWPESLEAVGVVKSPVVLDMVGWLVRFIYDRCDLILAQSRSFVPQIRQRLSHPVRIEYFPGWSESEPRGRAEPAPEVPPADTFNIVFAGNIGAAQDFPAILAAAERLRDRRDIRWIIVGDGRMAAWVGEEVRARGLSETVLLLGRFPPARMPSFYAHAGALLVSLQKQPIFSMTIPSKVQGYLAAGIPLLSMIDGETADVITRSGAGLAVPAGDAEALAGAAVKLATMSDDEREAMGRRGQKLAETEFHRTTLIAQLEAWLEELVANSKKGSAT